MALSPFANVTQLQAFWKTLTSDEQSRATLLLELASNRLRLIAEDNDIDMDNKVANSEAYSTTARWVVMEAVKRAMLTPTDVPPVETYSQTAGPYSENYKYTNPSGDLWFKKSELSALGLYGRQSLTSLSTSQNLYGDIYSS